MPQLVKQLQKEGIDTILRQNAEGLVYGVTFVDHKTKSVFNGSAIAKEYSAKGLRDKCNSNQLKVTSKGENVAFSKQELIDILEENKAMVQFKELPKFMDLLTKAENDYEYVAKELKPKKRSIRRNII